MDNWDLYNFSHRGNSRKPAVTELRISENGTYTAPTGVDGYNPVVVDVTNVSDVVQTFVKKRLQANGIETESMINDSDIIRDYALQDRISLTNIEVPNATSVGINFLRNCASLNSVKMPNVTNIGDYTMYNCISLPSLELPHVTSIGSYFIYDCISLNSLKMPHVTSIGNSSLFNCISLHSLELPNITSIGSQFMQGCISLNKIKLGGNQVATLLNSNAFVNTPIRNGTGYIYVPDNLVDEYKVATNWAVLADQIKGLSELSEEETE